jgi:hydroxymethylpyrimidine pyrophosphatase-like HAD family hydrolase
MTKIKTRKRKNVYAQSSIIAKCIKNKHQDKPLKIAFVDIDATLAGHPTVTKKAREKLEALDYVLVFTTARTEEMVMSKSAYEKSTALGFTRPKPRLAKKRGKYTYVDPKVYSANLVDPDVIIGSTGTQILIKQPEGGFRKDHSFEEQFNIPSRTWRRTVFDFIDKIDPEKGYIRLAPIESQKYYNQRKTNIYPTPYRVKIMFQTVKEKIKFLEAVKAEKQAKQFNFIDDSHPEKNQFLLYITPRKASKRYAVEHVVNNILKQLQISLENHTIKKSDLQVLLAGDSYPDLNMLFYGASGTKATAIAVGGSRLTHVLTHESLHIYAGENMKHFKKNLKIRKGGKGHYSFTDRNIIFGDYAFPKTIGPETILAYLDKFTLNNK